MIETLRPGIGGADVAETQAQIEPDCAVEPDIHGEGVLSERRQEDPLTRRDFLKHAFGLSLAAAALPASSCARPPRRDVAARSLPGDISRIQTPYGTCFVWYGSHDSRMNPSHMPPEIRGIAIETGFCPCMDVESLPEKLVTHVQYRDIFREAQKRSIPVYVLDPFPVKNSNAERYWKLSNSLESTLFFIGTTTALYVQRGNRRRFVKWLLSALGVWLSSPAVATLALSLKNSTGTRALAEFDRSLHPARRMLEFYALDMRNAIFAQKLLWIMRNGKSPSNLSLVVGALHSGVESALSGPESERLAGLKRRREGIIKNFDRRSLSAICPFEFRGGKWIRTGAFFEPELDRIFG